MGIDNNRPRTPTTFLGFIKEYKELLTLIASFLVFYGRFQADFTYLIEEVKSVKLILHDHINHPEYHGTITGDVEILKSFRKRDARVLRSLDERLDNHIDTHGVQ